MHLKRLIVVIQFYSSFSFEIIQDYHSSKVLLKRFWNIQAKCFVAGQEYITRGLSNIVVQIRLQLWILFLVTQNTKRKSQRMPFWMEEGTCMLLISFMKIIYKLLIIQNAVKKQDCSKDFSHKVSMTGNYDKHQCGIRIQNVKLEDAGEWKCEVCRIFL